MAGVTAPVTLAGAVAVGNAEILAGIVVNQILEPGRPVIYNLGLAHLFDMKHATAITGGPENAMFASASAELGRFYGLPSSSWVSTEALFEDEQAALEKMYGFQAHMSAGVGLIWGMGQLESEMTLSPAQLVIDNEMIAFVLRQQKGFVVSDETLALPLIGEVGIAGSYLDTEHTLTNFRREIFHPAFLNRASRNPGSKPLHEIARRRAAELIARDGGNALGQDIRDELRRIEEQFRNSP
jgi:trimethylamine--corrinoid protein Co-methyltransferase